MNPRKPVSPSTTQLKWLAGQHQTEQSIPVQRKNKLFFFQCFSERKESITLKANGKSFSVKTPRFHGRYGCLDF